MSYVLAKAASNNSSKDNLKGLSKGSDKIYTACCIIACMDMELLSSLVGF
jgi:predicted house-cleaning NTP pyrophosphatase (Maf/HAM1 superfamily)